MEPSAAEDAPQTPHRKDEAGLAKIKPQFILAATRKLDLAHVSDKDKAKLSEKGEEEPPKKKLKGQNKSRRKNATARIPRSEKMCLPVVRGQTCDRGSSCPFSHDIEQFLKDKPADIGPECYLFKTYGKCTHGISCRFAASHLDSENNNVVVDSLWSQHENSPRVKNELDKAVQKQLWKRSYDFGKAEMALGGIGSAKNAAGSIGPFTDEDQIKLRPAEKKTIDFKNKLYVAPLTTVGNLPFRRICKKFGADITCGEMALCTNILQGQVSEWALLKRHASEDLFGVQICGAHADVMTKCAQLISDTIEVDFVDINVGCPIDLIYRKGAGSGLMNRYNKFKEIVMGMKSCLAVPLTAKIRTGVYADKNTAHVLIPQLKDWGIDLITMHGRSREQRYTKNANWGYIAECAKLASPVPFFGNGDVLSFEDYNKHTKETNIAGIMLARGALIKPWLCTEIKEQRHWDISSGERFDMIRDYVNYGLDHWGSDRQGVEQTRKFLLEWLSFLYRYIPAGILEVLPQRINERPPSYRGRDDLETLLSSPSCSDWIKISEMLLGRVPDDFTFLPKHKANAYN